MLEIVDAKIKSITLLPESSLKAPAKLSIVAVVDENMTSIKKDRYRLYCLVTKNNEPTLAAKINRKPNPSYEIGDSSDKTIFEFDICISNTGNYVIEIGGNYYDTKKLEVEIK